MIIAKKIVLPLWRSGTVPQFKMWLRELTALLHRERIRYTLEGKLSKFFDVWQPFLDHVLKQSSLWSITNNSVYHPSVLLLFIASVEVVFLLLLCNLLPYLCVFALAVVLSDCFFSLISKILINIKLGILTCYWSQPLEELQFLTHQCWVYFSAHAH